MKIDSGMSLSRLRLADNGDQFVGGNDSLLGRGRVRRGLLSQAVGKGLVLESSKNSHALRPGIPVPRDQKIVFEE